MSKAVSPSTHDETAPERQSDDSATFLLAEYDRISQFRSELAQRASRRFEFFLTIAGAILGIYILVIQGQVATTPPYYLVNLAALAMLVYGAITYIDLTFASSYHLRIIQSYKGIQKYFTEHDPDIGKYLHLEKPASFLQRWQTPRNSDARYGRRKRKGSCRTD